jgi:hypothetical protein
MTAGLRTALVVRPHEFGDSKIPDHTPDPDFDYFATDFNDLADQLDCPQILENKENA